MITTLADHTWARHRLTQAQAETNGPIEIGLMIETPTAARQAATFRPHVNFVSIGTNDLTRSLPDPTQIWDLIAEVTTAFAGLPITVCGDLASTPDAVSTLITHGITTLSVRPHLIATIKQAIRRGDLGASLRTA
jgi:phosphocarrier protein FPr